MTLKPRQPTMNDTVRAVYAKHGIAHIDLIRQGIQPSNYEAIHTELVREIGRMGIDGGNFLEVGHGGQGYPVVFKHLFPGLADHASDLNPEPPEILAGIPGIAWHGRVEGMRPPKGGFDVIANRHFNWMGTMGEKEAFIGQLVRLSVPRSTHVHMLIELAGTYADELSDIYRRFGFKAEYVIEPGTRPGFETHFLVARR